MPPYNYLGIHCSCMQYTQSSAEMKNWWCRPTIFCKHFKQNPFKHIWIVDSIPDQSFEINKKIDTFVHKNKLTVNYHDHQNNNLNVDFENVDFENTSWCPLLYELWVFQKSSISQHVKNKIILVCMVKIE